MASPITGIVPVTTLQYLHKITVPLPKNILTKPDGTVWIQICFSGTGVFAKKGWVELRYLKEYYPPEGYELYTVKYSGSVTDLEGGRLGDLSAGNVVKVVVPKVLEPSPLAPDNRSEDRVKIIYGNGFGWFTEMQLEKGGMTVSQDYIDFVVDYEGGNTSTKWQYAEDLGHGVVTVAFGVVIKDRSGNYPLGKAKYDELIAKKNNQIPLTWNEALDLTTDYMETSYVTSVNQKATEKGWTLNQNRFDALVDMAWNCGSVSLDYKACAYLATGNLNDANILSQLEKEIAETAHMEIYGVNQWTKNLVERRADVIRIAKGGSDAYTRNEFTNQHWNQNAYTILSNMGLDAATISKYPIQQV